MAGILAGKVAIVTGGTEGMGKASAIRFAEAGASVVIADIDDAGEKVAAEIGGVFIHTDVTRSEDVDALVNAAVERFGKLDIMFNNAGTSRMAEVIDETDEQFWFIVRLNLGGVFNGCRAAGRQMKQQGFGSIISTSSIAGLKPIQSMCAYSASKAGVLSLTQCQAAELAPFNVRVNAICPGTVPTSMAEHMGLTPEIMAKLDGLQPMGRVGLPREIAEVALFLASDSASFITGHHIVADGGAMAANSVAL